MSLSCVLRENYLYSHNTYVHIYVHMLVYWHTVLHSESNDKIQELQPWQEMPGHCCMMCKIYLTVVQFVLNESE